MSLWDQIKDLGADTFNSARPELVATGADYLRNVVGATRPAPSTAPQPTATMSVADASAQFGLSNAGFMIAVGALAVGVFLVLKRK